VPNGLDSNNARRGSAAAAHLGAQIAHAILLGAPRRLALLIRSVLFSKSAQYDVICLAANLAQVCSPDYRLAGISTGAGKSDAGIETASVEQKLQP
jgi:hypothetical protein